MRRIASTLGPELAAMLERDLLQRADLHVISARSIAELVEAVADGVELCLVEPLLPDGDARAALEAVRDEQRGADVPVVLVVLCDTPAPDADGFSAVLTLPAATGAAEDVLARLLDSPRRRDARRAVSARVFDPGGAPIGRLVDVARGGVALRTRRAFAVGAVVDVAIDLPYEAEPLPARARVVRVAGEHVALALETPSPALAAALELVLGPAPIAGGLAFRPLAALGDRGASIGGTITDGPARVALLAHVAGGGADPPRLLVADLLPFDDAALDRWTAFVEAAAPFELHGCRPWMLALADRVPALLGRSARRAAIRSASVGVACAGCGDETERVVRIGDDAIAARATTTAVAAAPCAVCGGATALVDPIERAFDFLAR